MSEQVQHASGPVTIVERTPEGPAIRNWAGIIAIFKPNPFPQHWLEEHPQALANARRGAALWNACEGIPTEALEAGVVREMVEALESLVEGSYRMTTASENEELWQQAERVLRKARGEVAVGQ